MPHPRTRIALLGLAAATLAGGSHDGAGPAVAGCLAPSDVVIDAGSTPGPLWGNESGDLLYIRDLTGNKDSLILRTGIGTTVLAEEGQSNNFNVGGFPQRWVSFFSGALNADGDVAFVASTRVSDSNAPPGSDIPRRGAYAQIGNTLHQIGRFGDPSPVLGPGGPAPWLGFFDASPSDDDPNDLTVIFSGQVNDSELTTGLFEWNEQTRQVMSLVLRGQPSPAGGVFSSIGRARANGPGDSAFFAITALDPGNPDDPDESAGLFVRPAGGNAARLVKAGTDGDAAPGGGTFAILHDFDIDDSGNVCFAASLTGGGGSALFHQAFGGALSRVITEGDPTPLGGSYGTFEQAAVRLTAGGSMVLGVPLSDDVGGDGLFYFDPGNAVPTALANIEDPLGVAVFRTDGAAYMDEAETHAVVPADGTDEGPTDFRVARMDLKNKVSVRNPGDSITFEGRFRLPPYGDMPPAVFRTTGVTRHFPTGSFTGAGLTKIAEARVQVSDNPGNTLVFGIVNAETNPTGTVTYNGGAEPAPKVKIGKTDDTCSWKFKTSKGNGRFAVDLGSGTFSLKLRRGAIRESFLATAFVMEFTLRTDADVTAGREGMDAFFHRALTVNAEQVRFDERGAQVRNRGENVPGGTLFVDTLRVKRRLKVAKGAAAPQVTSDSILLSGTVRLCPSSTAPTTPGLNADITVGDFMLDDVLLVRKGRSGSRYQFKSGKGAPEKVDLRLDVLKGTFLLKVNGTAPLSQLVNADFSGADPNNGAGGEVGGMELPFSITVDRVYDADYDVPMVRRRGGKVFER